MSDSLDKLFRDQQNTVPPATPPPGQWARIRARQPVLVGGAGGVSGSLAIWKITLVFCVGLGAAVGTYYLSDAPVAEGKTSSASVSAVPIVAASPNVDTTVTDGALIASTAPAAAPTKLEKTSYAVESGLPAYSANMAAVNRPIVGADKAAAVPDSGRDVSSGKPGGKNMDASRPVLLARSEQTSVTGTEKPLVSGPASLLPPTEVAPVQSLYFDSLTDARVSAAALMPLNPVKIITRKPHRLARWEAGLHVTPFVSGARTNVYTYTEESNGFTPNRYDFGNRTVNLYPEDDIRQEIPRRFQVWIVSFELARQFSNGLRAGVGLFWMPPKVDGLVNQREILANQLSDGQWAINYTNERQSVYANLLLDYTFYRQRRFRPYAGVMLYYALYDDIQGTGYLFERSSGITEVVSTSHAVSDPGDDIIRVLPRIGFQYDLSERISIGTEIMPGFGIGGRWKW